MKSCPRLGVSVPVVAVVLLLLIAAIFLFLGMGGDTVCQVVSISPKTVLSASSVGSDQWRLLTEHAYVPIGWRVKLVSGTDGEEGKAILRFGEGSEILVTVGTEVHVKAVTLAAKVLKSIELKLSKGFCGFHIQNKPQKTVTVETPHAITSVLGTKFFVEVGEGASKVVVQEGTVKVEPKAGGKAMEVKAGSAWKTGDVMPSDLPAFFRKDDLWKMPLDALKKAIRQL